MRFPVMQRGSAVFSLILLISVTACTASLPRTTGPGPDKSSAGVSSTLRGRIFTSPEDDLFREGLSCLMTAEKTADYEKARSTFAALMTSYPKNKWSEAAQRFIALLDELQACQNKGSDDRKHGESLMRENENLRKNLKQVQERFQTEMQKLLQENEQLKKDLQLLRDLEIQLDKRERILR